MKPTLSVCRNVEDGNIVIGIQVTAQMIQRYKTCQGGAISALADAANCSGSLVADFRGTARGVKSN